MVCSGEHTDLLWVYLLPMLSLSWHCLLPGYHSASLIPAPKVTPQETSPLLMPAQHRRNRLKIPPTRCSKLNALVFAQGHPPLPRVPWPWTWSCSKITPTSKAGPSLGVFYDVVFSDLILLLIWYHLLSFTRFLIFFFCDPFIRNKMFLHDKITINKGRKQKTDWGKSLQSHHSQRTVLCEELLAADRNRHCCTHIHTPLNRQFNNNKNRQRNRKSTENANTLEMH